MLLLSVGRFLFSSNDPCRNSLTTNPLNTLFHQRRVRIVPQQCTRCLQIDAIFITFASFELTTKCEASTRHRPRVFLRGERIAFWRIICRIRLLIGYSISLTILDPCSSCRYDMDAARPSSALDDYQDSSLFRRRDLRFPAPPARYALLE